MLIPLALVTLASADTIHLDTGAAIETLKVFDDVKIKDAGIRDRLQTHFVTPELEAFWARNDTPTERREASAITSSAGNSRSSRMVSISRPTFPVAPTTARRKPMYDLPRRRPAQGLATTAN